MKFTIRIKFFVVLLAFSLGPLILSRAIMGRAGDKRAKELSEQTRSELLAIVSDELAQNAKSLRAILESQSQTTTLAIRMLGHQTERLLAEAAPDQGEQPVFTFDFSDPSLLPKDAAFAPGYERRTMSGKTRPIKVSFGYPSFHLAPRTREEDVADDIRRLQTLQPLFKEVFDEMEEAAYWFNVGLESGLFMTYPGHGNFPMMYDHRDQQWYKRTLAAKGKCEWTTPVVDPSTRRAYITGGYPLRDKHGATLGTVTIDVPLSSLLHDSELQSRWSGDVQSFMVTSHPDGENVDGLLILAQQSYDSEGRRHWMAGIEPEWMKSDDPIAFKKLLEAMRTSDGGVMRLPYKGKDSVWAYSSNPDFSFLLISPVSVVTLLPDHVTGSIDSMFAEMRDISAIISGIMLIITGLIAWFGSRTVTKPLLIMADAAKRLAKGDFSVRIDMETGDERDQLINSFNEMGPQLKEREHLRRDMELAQEVQNLLLPTAPPNLSGFDIAGGIAYCDHTGGDYYDFIDQQADTGSGIGVVLGDVSGHGVPSALIMAEARGQLHSLSSVPLTPAQRINTVNKLLSRDLDGTGRFITMFYICLKENDPVVRWVRAGHDPAIRYNPATDEFSELGGEGLALGVMDEYHFDGYETAIEPSEVLLLATDGVWEARNSAGEMFGKKRMLALLKENAHNCSEEIRKAIMNGVEAFQANGQEDDIAVVVIKKDS